MRDVYLENGYENRVRNAETLEWVETAPIFDSGSSLWFSKPQAFIFPSAKVPCKPFKADHNEQIKLVTSFNWLDFSALRDIDEEFHEILNGSLFIDEVRRNALCSALRRRVEMLAEFVHSRATQFPVDDLSKDVLENTAYSGTEAENEDWER